MMRIFIFTVFTLISSLSYSSIDVESLLKKISLNSPKKINFTETKSASFLTAPVVSKGVMEIDDSGDIIKHLSSPYKSEQHISGGMLFVKKDNSEGRVILLENYPALEAGINSIRWFVLGDSIKLNKNFVINYSIEGETWLVTLIPKNKEALISISSINITGTNGFISRSSLRILSS